MRGVSRRYRPGVRHVRGAALVRQRARAADVVYTTGMFGRSAARRAARAEAVVVKLTADPAFERARRCGLVEGDVDEFQSRGGGATLRSCASRATLELRHAAHVFTPSAYLRELALGWGVPPERVTVLPNPAPLLPELGRARSCGGGSASNGRRSSSPAG